MKPSEDDVERFAATVQRFAQTMAQAARGDRISPIRELVDGLVGVDTSMTPILSETFPSWDHVNVQVVLSAWLDAEERSHDLVGLTGQHRHYSPLSDMLDIA